jgi:hydroxyacylglutathione hydrolase
MEAGYLAIDIRTPASFAAGHLPGAYNVPLESEQFEQWVGWVIPKDTPLLLLSESSADVERALQKLAFLGLDGRVAGYGCSDIVAPATSHRPKGAAPGGPPMPRSLMRFSPQQLYQRLRSNGKRGREPGLRVLDVRTCREWQNGHIPGAQQWSLHQLSQQIEALPLSYDERVAVVCTSGVRSSIASSILLHHGYRFVYNVAGGMNAWQAANLPVLEASEDETCPIGRQREMLRGSRPQRRTRKVPASNGGAEGLRQSAKALASIPTPVGDGTSATQDPGLPYWMELGDPASVN